jgi:hypothetical protein
MRLGGPLPLESAARAGQKFSATMIFFKGYFIGLIPRNQAHGAAMLQRNIVGM